MDPDARAELERELRDLCMAGDHERAVTAALRGYGAEIHGFLIALARDEALAREALSQLSEDLWRGIAGFAGRASLRTWMYTLARHALLRCQKREQRHRRGQVPASIAECVAEQARSVTLPFLRTAVKDRMAELRESLPQEDQALLILRVDKGLEWSELAQVLSEGQERTGEALKRESARLRKRFQLVKDKLRRLAEAEGLIAAAE